MKHTGKSATQTKETTMSLSAQATAASRPQFTIIKRVTRELFRIEKDTQYLIRFDGAMELAPEVDEAPTKRIRKVKAAPVQAFDENGKPIVIESGVPVEKKERPVIAPVTMLDNGAEGQIIVPSVLESEMLRQYPDDSYVGRSFMLVKHDKAQGKSYFRFDIAEIQIGAPSSDAETAPAVKAKK